MQSTLMYNPCQYYSNMITNHVLSYTCLINDCFDVILSLLLLIFTEKEASWPWQGYGYQLCLKMAMEMFQKEDKYSLTRI
jgi:hypothetical protein